VLKRETLHVPKYTDVHRLPWWMRLTLFWFFYAITWLVYEFDEIHLISRVILGVASLLPANFGEHLNGQDSACRRIIGCLPASQGPLRGCFIA